MYNSGDFGFGSVLILFGIVCAVVGWAVIELLIWLFSFIHISFGR